MYLGRSVSLVMPIYKKEKSIGEILSQFSNTTNTIDEFVFIIDGDFDLTGQIVTDWCKQQDKPSTIVYESDINEVLCCVSGGAKATSEILIFVQDDMLFYENNWDEKLCELVLKYGLVGGRVGTEFSVKPNKFNSLELVWKQKIGRDTQIGTFVLWLLRLTNIDLRFIISGQRTYVNRGPFVILSERYKALGGFDSIFAPMDFDCMDLSCKHTKRYGLPFVMPVGYDEYHGSKTFSVNSAAKSRTSVSKNMPIIIDRHSDLAK